MNGTLIDLYSAEQTIGRAYQYMYCLIFANSLSDIIGQQYQCAWVNLGFVFWAKLRLALGVNTEYSFVYWGLTPQQQPASYRGGEMMMMKFSFTGGGNRGTPPRWGVRQVTDKLSNRRPAPSPRNLGRRGVKLGDPKRHESNTLAH